MLRKQIRCLEWQEYWSRSLWLSSKINVITSLKGYRHLSYGLGIDLSGFKISCVSSHQWQSCLSLQFNFFLSQCVNAFLNLVMNIEKNGLFRHLPAFLSHKISQDIMCLFFSMTNLLVCSRTFFVCVNAFYNLVIKN